MKHTDGPWAINTQGIIFDEKTDSCIAIFDDTHIRKLIPAFSRHPEIMKANGLLIAYAPELLEASSRLITAIDQQSFFFEGYRNGSASISECNAATDELGKAKSNLFDIIKKAKGL